MDQAQTFSHPLPHLEIKNLVFSYQGRKLLHGLSCCIFPGAVTVLLGPSGAGKSTLLRIIAGFEKQEEGYISRAVTTRYLPQDEVLLPWKTVEENILLPIQIRKEPNKKQNKTLLQRGLSSPRGLLYELANEFDLTPLLPLFPDQLSGGQKQIVAFVRHLLDEGDLMLLDEPFSNVDAYIRVQLLQALGRHVGPERSALLVTHDFHDARRFADRIILLANGQIAGSWEKNGPENPNFEKLDLEDAMRSCYER